MVKKKKRGRKPGVKVGPYKKALNPMAITDINKALDDVRVLIKNRISELNKLLRSLK